MPNRYHLRGPQHLRRPRDFVPSRELPQETLRQSPDQAFVDRLAEAADPSAAEKKAPETEPAVIETPAIDVGRVTGEAQHLVVSYTPGHLRAFLDGQPTADSREQSSGFFHWQQTYLRLSAEGPPNGAGAIPDPGTTALMRPFTAVYRSSLQTTLTV